MNNSFTLEGKTIVVTGGSGILGTAFVHAIASAKGNVVIADLNITAAEKLAAEVNAKGCTAIAVETNVLDEAQLITARTKILEQFGRIDGLVNAAGGNVPEGVHPADADIFSLNIEGMKKAMVLNLWGTIIPTQVFGKVMADQGSGSIVNISSVTPKRAITKVLGYSMGKAAVDCFNQWFAVEVANRFGDKIRVNAIMPGFFLTDQNRTLLTAADGSLTERGNTIIKQTPFKRFGSPEELTGALIFLLSDASKFVTGMQIGVDGGFTINGGV